MLQNFYKTTSIITAYSKSPYYCKHEISIINKDDVNLFQDEKLFEDLGNEKPFENSNLLKVNFGIQFICLLMYMTINILL